MKYKIWFLSCQSFRTVRKGQLRFNLEQTTTIHPYRKPSLFCLQQRQILPFAGTSHSLPGAEGKPGRPFICSFFSDPIYVHRKALRNFTAEQ